MYAADDFKATNNLTLNLGLRWDYTSPLVEKDNRQANIDLTNAAQRLAGQDGNSRALYTRITKGGSRGSASRTPGNRWVFRGAYGITQYMEGTGANLRLPLNPPFFFESQVGYDATSGPARSRPVSRACRRRAAFGAAARVGPESAPAVHAAVERLRRVPPGLEVVHQRRLCGQQVDIS